MDIIEEDDVAINEESEKGSDIIKRKSTKKIKVTSLRDFNIMWIIGKGTFGKVWYLEFSSRSTLEN
jgi:hypothetical protein